MSDFMCQRIETLHLNDYDCYNMSSLHDTLLWNYDELPCQPGEFFHESQACPPAAPVMVHQDEYDLDWENQSKIEWVEEDPNRQRPDKPVLLWTPPPRRQIATVLIYGHSYIRRLNHFLVNDRGAYHNLGLDFQLADVQWYGKGGLRADYAYYQHLEAIYETRPHILYIQLGSNDLCSVAATPTRVSEYLASLANLALQAGVERVIIGQTIKRKKHGIPYSTPQYNLNVALLNRINARKFRSHPRISFWKHVGFERPVNAIMARDGVHLNKVGQRKYFRSVRGAVLVNLRKLNFHYSPVFCQQF